MADHKNLKAFKQCLDRNTNIMLSYTAFAHGSTFIIISPLADLDLHKFFRGSYPDFQARQRRFTPIALLKESLGLAAALNFLHDGLRVREGQKVACGHLDLKPENILVKWGATVVGRWKIHDFGTSRIKEPSTINPKVSGLLPGDFIRQFSFTRASRAPGPFQAPEVQFSQERVISRESDMWSFGCILAFTLAFAIGGPKHILQLAKTLDESVSEDTETDDYFYTTDSINKSKFIIKPKVAEWLKSLKIDNSGKTPWVNNTLNLIFSTLVVDTKARLKASDALNRLDAICSEKTHNFDAVCSWVPTEEDFGMEMLAPISSPVNTQPSSTRSIRETSQLMDEHGSSPNSPVRPVTPPSNPTTSGSGLSDTGALAYQANGQVKEVVEIQETTLAADHRKQLASQRALAVVYKANEQVKEAVELLDHVAAVQDTTRNELREDIDSDLGSIISVDSQETAIQGSEPGGPSTSLATTLLTETARDQLLLIFTEDEALRALYVEALQKRKLQSGRFENNLQRLIRKFCIELQPGAHDLLNLKALGLIRSQKRWIARQIREQFSPLNATRVERMHELRKQIANKRPTLENYLATTRAQAAMEETSRQVMDPGVISNINDRTDSSSNSGVSDKDSSQSDDAEHSEFPHFEEVRAFLVNGGPFQNLRNNFRHFVYPNLSKDSATGQPDINISDAASSLLIVEKMQYSISIIILGLLWAVVLFYATLVHLYCRICRLPYDQFFNNIFRTSPLPPGIIRLEWICVRLLRFVY
jgi:serine/threonine protein kinase